MMEAVCTSEMLVDNNFTRQYIPEDNSEHHTYRYENLKSHIFSLIFINVHELKYVLLQNQHLNKTAVHDDTVANTKKEKFDQIYVVRKLNFRKTKCFYNSYLEVM
jgi:hypothetical protein